MDDATITSITSLSPDVRQYSLSLVDGIFDGAPGQHTIVHTHSDDGDGPGAARPYSVIAVRDDTIVVAIRGYEHGTVSSYMHQRTVGDMVSVERSLVGNLTLSDPAQPVAFISTGTGITPMIGMLHEYVTSDGPDAVFLYGARTRDQLLYKATLTQRSIRDPVDVEFVLSRESWEGREGYVQAHLDDVFDSFSGRDYYVCGVPEMVVETTRALDEREVPSDRLHTEGWERSDVS